MLVNFEFLCVTRSRQITSSSRDCSRTFSITWQDSSRSNWITPLF